MLCCMLKNASVLQLSGSWSQTPCSYVFKYEGYPLFEHVIQRVNNSKVCSVLAVF